MKWSFYASGFREKRGKHTGTKSNAHKVRDEHQETAIVRYVEWNDNPKGYALDLASRWTEGDTVTVEGYSWGCGNWIHKFLWTLFKANPAIRIHHLTLVDPVVHTRWWSLRWFAVTDWGKITLPDNISDDVVVFYQRVDEPNASKLIFKGKVIAKHFELNFPHTKIDNAKAVTDMTLEVADRYLS